MKGEGGKRNHIAWRCKRNSYWVSESISKEYHMISIHWNTFLLKVKIRAITKDKTYFTKMDFMNIEKYTQHLYCSLTLHLRNLICPIRRMMTKNTSQFLSSIKCSLEFLKLEWWQVDTLCFRVQSIPSSEAI